MFRLTKSAGGLVDNTRLTEAGPTRASFQRTLLTPFVLPLPSQTLSDKYAQEVVDEEGLTEEERIVAKAGKMDAKKRLEGDCAALMSANIVQCMGSMLDAIAF